MQTLNLNVINTLYKTKLVLNNVPINTDVIDFFNLIQNQSTSSNISIGDLKHINGFVVHRFFKKDIEVPNISRVINDLNKAKQDPHNKTLQELNIENNDDLILTGWHATPYGGKPKPLPLMIALTVTIFTLPVLVCIGSTLGIYAAQQPLDNFDEPTLRQSLGCGISIGIITGMMIYAVLRIIASCNNTKDIVEILT